MQHLTLSVLICLTLAFAGCGRFAKPAPQAVADAPATGLRPMPRPGAIGALPATSPKARTAAALDRTSDADKAAVLAAPAAGTELGRVVVSLGNPAEQGFWLRSGLVKAPRPGVVRLASGKTAQVDLLPVGAGGGPQMSLATFRALGLGLTDLPEVIVLGR